MKKNIIRHLFFIFFITAFVSPLGAETTEVAPILDPFPYSISSLYGPRIVVNQNGQVCETCSKFHKGIDFAGALGSMIQSKTDGKIIDFKRNNGGGWTLYVAPDPRLNLETTHSVKDFHYMHLFTWDGTVPGVLSAQGYTDVKTVDVEAIKVVNIDGLETIITITCPGIAFWKGDDSSASPKVLAKVLTREECNGGFYGKMEATSFVKAGEEIAPIGISNLAPVKGNSGNVAPHLHFGMNRGLKDNPFYVLKRVPDKPANPYFKATLLNSSFNLNNMPATPGFWIEITTNTELSLDKVEVYLNTMRFNGFNSEDYIPTFETDQYVPYPTNWWTLSFGGRPGEQAIFSLDNNKTFTALTDGFIYTSSNDKDCAAPLVFTTTFRIQPCDWNGTSPKRIRLFIPFDKFQDIQFKNMNYLFVRMTSINGYISDTNGFYGHDPYEYPNEPLYFTLTSDCKNPRLGELCDGGVVYYNKGGNIFIASTIDMVQTVTSWITEDYYNIETGANGWDLGEGAANTEKILNAHNGSPYSNDFAAKIASEYRTRPDGTYCSIFDSDYDSCIGKWHLPSWKELIWFFGFGRANLVYHSRNHVQDFYFNIDHRYWSSTEFSNTLPGSRFFYNFPNPRNSAIGVSYLEGLRFTGDSATSWAYYKQNPLYVRAVKRFTPPPKD